MKKKLGRPPVPKKQQKGSLLSVRFSAQEREDLERAAENEGIKLSAWARKVLVRHARGM